jgi:superfamily II RNA helicase
MSELYPLPKHAPLLITLTERRYADSETYLGLETTAGPSSNGASECDADMKDEVVRVHSSLAQRDPRTRSEKDCLGLIVLAKILRDGTATKSNVAAFLVHFILMEEIQISKRRLDLIQDADVTSPITTLIQKFAVYADYVLSNQAWAQAMSGTPVVCDIVDLVDGRLLQHVIKHKKSVMEAMMATPHLAAKLSSYCELIETLSGVELDAAKNAPSSVDQGKPHTLEDSTAPRLAILPFSSPIFDKHLVSINISVDKDLAPKPESARIFQEVTHWHNVKRRLDPKAAHTLSAKDKFWALKRNQYFMAEMLSYAASLTNASGKALDPEIITVSDMKKIGQKTQEAEKENLPIAKISKAQGGKGTSKGKAAGSKAVRDEIAATRAAKEEDSVEKIYRAWETARKFFDADALPRSRYVKAKAYLISLPSNKQKHVEAEVEFYKLCALFEVYRSSDSTKEANKQTADGNSLGVAAMLWDSVRKLSSLDNLTKTIVDNAQQIVMTLGLPAVDFAAQSSTRQLSFTPNLRASGAPRIPSDLDPKDFQLLHYGPYMDRNLDSASDPRVPFEPDGWQRKVLDGLDAEKSVFVVAPTSAGKTFISFYAMEQILRKDNDGVIVYVAPTKALVNQIAAEIQARFNKAYKYSKSVWAIHTRDYRINNPSQCQILVTVPHILQIMLLSPSNARTWSPRLRYIIFDEIHSIGQAEDGVVWEQLLLLAPCPIIALSATVGNPGQFSSWLSSTQGSLGNELTMIQHPHRYSDLRKFVYSPPKKFAFHGLSESTTFGTLGLDGLEGLQFMHPIASLINRSRGMPDDLSLEARDCLLLWRAMSRHQTTAFPVTSDLDPKVALPAAIRKADVIEWETDLKELLRKWMSDDASPFEKVVDELSNPASAQAEVSQISSRYAIEEGADGFADVNADSLTDTTLPLLCRLNERNALPAIFFNYDRGGCEGICLSLLTKLKAAEDGWKKHSPIWAKKLAEWESWKKTQAKMAAKKPAKPAAKKKGNKDPDEETTTKADQVQDTANTEANPLASFNPDDPIDGFHFAARHKQEQSELSIWLRQLRKRGVQPFLMDALSRGIGVHHAGMNRKYRQVVEMLFRKGYLRVVIATGTLALGINMPCATVVFSGDSIFLTALNFRQAAGRAGRRGFDLLGNVVFQNMSYAKVCRLLSSRLPDLNGHFPITTTLVLRLFMLLQESDDAPYAVRAINSLLSQPRLYLDGSAFREQVLHHLRFSIEYLRRQSLLSAQGAPINFAGLTSHLYYTENSSFALNALIKEGYFHRLCADINDKESSVLRELMVAMAHLFGRRPCKEADQEYLEDVVKRSSSIVFLPRLPESASNILRRHNKETLDIFTTYVDTFVDQHIKDEDCRLPLTELEFKGTKSSTNSAIQDLGFLPPTKVRSAFVALSGHGDTFSTISDLCHTARGGVFLEEAVIPHLDVYPDEASTPLNAYLYDFYMHGDVEPLEKANGIRKADVWFLLNDFSMVLATITTSLANFLKLPESDISMIDIIGEGDQANNKEDDMFAADTVVGIDDDASSTTTLVSERGKAVAAASVTTKAPSTKKKKTLDSWDDEEEDDNDDDDAETNGLGSEGMETRTVDEMERGFLNVYKAFSLLKKDFDEKFHAMWA